VEACVRPTQFSVNPEPSCIHGSIVEHITANRPLAVFGVLLLLAAGGAVLAMILLVSIFERKQEARNPFFRVLELTDETEDPAVWGKNFPMRYDGYRCTMDQERTRYGGNEALPHSLAMDALVELIGELKAARTANAPAAQLAAAHPSASRSTLRVKVSWLCGRHGRRVGHGPLGRPRPRAADGSFFESPFPQANAPSVFEKQWRTQKVFRPLNADGGRPSGPCPTPNHQLSI
jgi:hypothetical protein